MPRIPYGEKLPIVKKNFVFSQKRKRAHEDVERRMKKTSMCNFSTTFADVEVDPLSVYLRHLRNTGLMYLAFDNSAIIMADCDKSGHLVKTYVVLECIQYLSENGAAFNILTCKCQKGRANKEQLSCLNMEGVSTTECEELSKYCIHCRAASSHFGVIVCPVTQADANEMEVLQDDPYLAAVKIDGDIGIVRYNAHHKSLCCMECAYGRSSCEHVQQCRNCTSPSEGYTEPPTSNFNSVSWRKVPYPMTRGQQELSNKYLSGEISYSPYLLPLIEDGSCCRNGFRWSQADPVKKGWVHGDVVIYKLDGTITYSNHGGVKTNIRVFYRLCTGLCKCKLEYDGQQHLLFNLNNRELFCYRLLINYLHQMIEGRNPLSALHRTVRRNNYVLSSTAQLPIHKLRLAWNAFARLLDIKYDDVFKCRSCGDVPDVVVCDGTFLGCKKQYLKPYLNEVPATGETLTGSRYSDRTLILKKITRTLLSVYSSTKTAVSGRDFSKLLSQLRKEKNGKALADVITTIDQNRTPPVFARKLLRDLSKSSPVCAIVQSNDLEQTTNALIQIGNGTQSTENLALLSEHSPVISSFLKGMMTNHTSLPHCVLNLLLDIARCVTVTYSSQDERRYAAPMMSLIDQLSFFPGLPKLHSEASYTIDGVNAQTDSCRKLSLGHPTLSPGIFTIFCPHGVCYGFELMTSHESPRHPFSIFKSRFPVAPKLIVYDNACKLHEYSLNREPVFFQNTIFCVDRLHWKNHTGCSSGYSLSTYKDRFDVISLNSQVNEQANSYLGRIKSQLAYMLPDNFIFHTALFLAIKNMDKIKELQNE